MKLSISNIAWGKEFDTDMYAFLCKAGYCGLEIAPTRLFPENPYDKIQDIKDFARSIYEQYGFVISSMQSIWYGKTQSIFGSQQERQQLIDYTKKAVDFAYAAGCHNLVFGCPKNRVIPDSTYIPEAIEFFNIIGDYAASSDTVIALEANPPIYNTNFMNTTHDAFEICRKCANKGVMVNLDLGTVIYNNETLDEVKENTALVNHIHISEPYLAPIEKRQLHSQLKTLDYDKFISIEMGNKDNIEQVKNAVKYVAEVLL
ncbi:MULTISPECIES: sugar phosphate isomerase/epimerase [unclassified Ruminococcus]|uniref:sugar phosphate isomerase/epimerase family protein n=1 Tax=unclassified Ruminococcus TaxID=2608920 RepID=UPI00210EDCF7|nr:MULTISPECIES: sugar phosphate isomerase/epimerase [unclassified Ruminococcus]MCQ4023115.1 TIM barrel protein [Ruminococcus sp. zg-924]MCQ4115114.1 TIM barrel protein [Ruminococcus sp. zg-921]